MILFLAGLIIGWLAGFHLYRIEQLLKRPEQKEKAVVVRPRSPESLPSAVAPDAASGVVKATSPIELRVRKAAKAAEEDRLLRGY